MDLDATVAIEDVRAETSRRLRTVAHLAATPPTPWLEDGSGAVDAVLAPGDAGMVGSHSPSRTGLRRVVGAAFASPVRADGGGSDSASPTPTLEGHGAQNKSEMLDTSRSHVADSRVSLGSASGIGS